MAGFQANVEMQENAPCRKLGVGWNSEAEIRTRFYRGLADGLMHSKYGQQDDHESAKLALDPRKAKATVLACSSYEGSRTLDN